jgi:hypothetical protein
MMREKISSVRETGDGWIIGNGEYIIEPWNSCTIYTEDRPFPAVTRLQDPGGLIPV